MSIYVKAAEIFTAYDYAYESRLNEMDGTVEIVPCKGNGVWDYCDPFCDTLEGRRQADFLEGQFIKKKHDLWVAGLLASAHESFDSERKRRLWIIKQCLGEL